MDSSSQFEKQLSAQWHQIANKMGLPCNKASNSQPIKERLSQAIEFLEDGGKSPKEALFIIQTAVNVILGTNSEAEMNKLLELEGLSSDEPLMMLPVNSFGPAFGKGTPSTGLSTEHSSPTLVLSTGSPHHSPLPANKKAIGKSTSSGDVIFKSKKRLPNLSQTSLFDSGIGSLNTSHNCCHCTPPILSKSQSCPSTPQHSVSNLSPARKHESVKQTRSLDSTPTHSAVCISPRPLSSKTHREHYPGDDSQSPAGNGVCQFCKWVNVLSRASELSAVPETEDHNSNNGSCSELHVSGSAISSQTDLRVAVLEEKVDILSEVVSRLELNDLKPSKGTQLCLPENFRSRGKSEGEKTMIKKKPGLKKAFSAEDTSGVTTEAELLRNYSPVSSLHTERNKVMEEDHENQGSVSTVNVHYVQEDLTREELVTIANHMNPKKGSMLSSGLHKDLRVWDDVVQRYPHAPSEELILRVLERWFENVPPGSVNRQTLAIVCDNIGQKRLAHSIANKVYTWK